MKAIISLTILAVVAFVSASATIINVPDDYLTIQEGIDASTDGDTVLVQQGTYVENINFNGHNIVLGSLFLITGDTTYIPETVIDGDSVGTVVTFENGEDSSAVITGFTIRNGCTGTMGGGISCSYASPKINNNHISHNCAISNNNEELGQGGGISCWHSNANISNNLLYGNIAINTASNQRGYGGAIGCRHSDVSITNNYICENRAMARGGGVSACSSSVTLVGNHILQNSVYPEQRVIHARGGGIALDYSVAQLNENYIMDNFSAWDGGGISIIFCSDPNIYLSNNLIIGNNSTHGAGIYCGTSKLTIRNNVVFENIAEEQGGGIWTNVWDDNSIVLYNNVIRNNIASLGNQILLFYGRGALIEYNNIEDGWDGPGNIDVLPQFRDPNNRDFHLMASMCGDPLDSPCIDAGRPDISDTLLDCSWGLGSTIADMGAFGGGHPVYGIIQDAINSSTDGDTIIVQPGVYYENLNFNGRDITLGSLYLATGDTSFISETIIDGRGRFSVVSFKNYETPLARIVGFTIRNGRASRGGGIYCYNSSPTIVDNIITSNAAGGAGLAWKGGGIYCGSYSYPIIINNVIINNHAESFEQVVGVGGGIYASYTSPSIYGNLIRGNWAFGGGGISCGGSNNIPIVVNNIIIENTAAGYGGGILIHGSNSGSAIFNNIIRDNLYDQVSGSTVPVTYSNIQGGWEGEGNIDVDPLFRDPENGDFHLMSIACGDPFDSPCIDAGHPDILDSLLDCSWGLGELRSDMGAYGGGDSVIVGFDQDDIPFPQEFYLFQNYPNPFNSSTVIRYALPEPSQVTIEIYDILGRRVETLIDENQQAGYHRVIWNAGNFPSGVYFAKLRTLNESKSIKMLLLR